MEEYQLILLDIGTATITIDGGKYTYVGTVNQAGKAHGLGVATKVFGSGSYTGTFKDGVPHGQSKNSRLLS